MTPVGRESWTKSPPSTNPCQ
jgi:hypothetical protein